MTEELMGYMLYLSIAVVLICGYAVNAIVIILWKLRRKDSERPIAPAVRAFAVLAIVIPSGMALFGLASLVIQACAYSWDFLARLIFDGQI